MAPVVIRYPLDPTGVNPDNLVSGEIQTMPARTVRAIAPAYGAFFSDSLVVTDTVTNLVLTADQYYAAEMYSLPSYEFGLEICSIIMITDPSVSNTVSLQYQALGGEYSSSQQAIIQQIYNLNLDDRPVTWPAIIGKPDAFPPSAHLHDAGDLYGFEYVTNALDRIRAAILLGDDASHDAIYKYIDLATDSIASGVAALQTALNNHLANFENPHQVTAAEVGAYTKAQADANLAALQTTLQGNINTVNAALTAHENNTGNPHLVNAAQVGAYTKAQSDSNLSAAVTTLNGTISSNVTNLQNQINAKAPAAGDYAFTDRSQDVTFGNIIGTGTIYSYNDIWAFISDERLKTNIETIQNPLEKLHQIRGVTYNHNSLAEKLIGVDPKREFVGFLTNELEAVLPQVVGAAPFDVDPHTGKSISGLDFKTAQYERISALLTEAVKAVDRKLEGALHAMRRSGLGSCLPISDGMSIERQLPELMTV